MIADISILEKSFGQKVLYRDLSLQLQAGEKVGLIGRNGTGKSTLFNMLTGEDGDYSGHIKFSKNLSIIASRQEHQEHLQIPVLEYILADLPEYSSLKHILDTYPSTMGSSMTKMNNYSEALERFSTLGYFDVEALVARSLEAYQLTDEQINGRLGSLSGGQKRFVELVKVQHSGAGLVLIDEPTNHMDYVAKEAFLEWFKAESASVLVITHDRDVLGCVDKIIEIRDGRVLSFRGNYDAFLRTNTSKIVSEVNEYEVTQSRIKNLKEDVIRFRRLKEKSRNPGTIHRFKSQEQKASAELLKLQGQDKPSFWIDQESVQGLNSKLAGAYQEHKARNIRVRTSSDDIGNRLLLEAHQLSLGYDQPLFADVSFQVREGERLKLHGRNGAGKTTLIDAVLAQASGFKSKCTIFHGRVITEIGLKIGVYKQEIEAELLKSTLYEAVEQSLMQKGIKTNDQKVRQLLGDYLFEPMGDGQLPLSKLSGGQKARFQLICMLADDPQLLILDEPTNHLDLPSIEELESALLAYSGAILYVSHDSYFTKNLPAGTVLVETP